MLVCFTALFPESLFVTHSYNWLERRWLVKTGHSQCGASAGLEADNGAQEPVQRHGSDALAISLSIK